MLLVVFFTFINQLYKCLIVRIVKLGKKFIITLSNKNFQFLSIFD